MKEKETVSELTLRRLPKYRNYLIKLCKSGQEFTSASEISREFDVHHTQVRKDLAITGVRGIPKVGHVVEELIVAIEEYLNWNNISDAFLIGAGKLGKAILGYHGFEKAGIKIVAAFDTNPEIIGTEIEGIPVFPMDKLNNLAQRLHIHIGIITVTQKSAQQAADSAINSGIIALWNFTPVNLQVPEDIIVENVDIYPSLAVLSKKIAYRKSERTKILKK
ncbi:MAG: redox-sensing transcriptional repressor Rex [Candidatus Cloacimonadota bacterium]|nr:MAG: redox-sensing transcriptional repressor Rex [Candidatus Cloacimonadota bacterium]